MLKWIGIVLMVGVVLRLLGLKLVSSILFGIAGAIFLLLLILHKKKERINHYAKAIQIHS